MQKNKIRIACVGNMNNNMFSVMRHLRHEGYLADLIYSNEFNHFLPQADTFEDDYLDYVYEFDFDKNSILQTNRYSINKYFSKYNFIIACGSSIAYLTYANINIDIVIPYGSDLYNLPFFELQPNMDKVLNRWRVKFALNQKKGIENATAIILDNTSDEFETVGDKFNFKGYRYKYPCPFIFTHEFNWKNATQLQSKSKYSASMLALREKYDFIAFSHIRQSWKNPEDIWSYKGNDRIFRAFKDFLTSTNSQACLVVFEYGIDVENSKTLVSELGIEENVVWFPLMQRKDILTMISFVDVGIGEIGNYSWFSYGAIYEFLCMKKPVIHWRDDSMYLGKIDSFYPMYSAANENQVCMALKECYNNQVKSAQIAEEAYIWYIQNAIEAPIKVIISIISKKNWRFIVLKKNANLIVSSFLSVLLFAKNQVRRCLPSIALSYVREIRL